MRMICFASWLTCCCSVDRIFDDPRAAAITAVSFLVMVLSAMALAGGGDE